MLGALIATGLANSCAQGANSFRVFAIARHRSGCQSAYRGAVHIECDAARHRFYIGFFQARGCAVVAACCAGVAGLNTGGKFMLSHPDTPRFEKYDIKSRTKGFDLLYVASWRRELRVGGQQLCT